MSQKEIKRNEDLMKLVKSPSDVGFDVMAQYIGDKGAINALIRLVDGMESEEEISRAFRVLNDIVTSEVDDEILKRVLDLFSKHRAGESIKAVCQKLESKVTDYYHSLLHHSDKQTRLDAAFALIHCANTTTNQIIDVVRTCIREEDVHMMDIALTSLCESTQEKETAAAVKKDENLLYDTLIELASTKGPNDGDYRVRESSIRVLTNLVELYMTDSSELKEVYKLGLNIMDEFRKNALDRGIVTNATKLAKSSALSLVKHNESSFRDLIDPLVTLITGAQPQTEAWSKRYSKRLENIARNICSAELSERYVKVNDIHDLFEKVLQSPVIASIADWLFENKSVGNGVKEAIKTQAHEYYDRCAYEDCRSILKRLSMKTVPSTAPNPVSIPVQEEGSSSGFNPEKAILLAAFDDPNNVSHLLDSIRRDYAGDKDVIRALVRVIPVMGDSRDALDALSYIVTESIEDDLLFQVLDLFSEKGNSCTLSTLSLKEKLGEVVKNYYHSQLQDADKRESAAYALNNCQKTTPMQMIDVVKTMAALKKVDTGMTNAIHHIASPAESPKKWSQAVKDDEQFLDQIIAWVDDSGTHYNIREPAIKVLQSLVVNEVASTEETRKFYSMGLNVIKKEKYDDTNVFGAGLELTKITALSLVKQNEKFLGVVNPLLEALRSDDRSYSNRILSTVEVICRGTFGKVSIGIEDINDLFQRLSSLPFVSDMARHLFDNSSVTIEVKQMIKTQAGLKHAQCNDQYAKGNLLKLSLEKITIPPQPNEEVEESSRGADISADSEFSIPENTTPERKELFKQLFESIKNMELTELHTHLMGMGSWKFWMEEIMGMKATDAGVWEENSKPGTISRCRQIVAENVTKLEIEELCNIKELIENGHDKANDNYAYPVDRDNAIRFMAKYPNVNFTKESEDYVKGQQTSHLTIDVIYSEDILKEAVLKKDKKLKKMNIDDLLDLLIGPDPDDRTLFQNYLHNYLVFSVRDQQFEMRQGLSHSDLMKLLSTVKPETNKFLVNKLKNMFTMLGTDEHSEVPTDKETIENFHGCFTPEFYPKRFVIKDAMYSQYLGVLDDLLEHALKKYQTYGVGYVEFSVGFGDLLTRPWVFRHLERKVQKYEMLPERPVSARFLAGFSRMCVPITAEDFEKACSKLERNISHDGVRMLEEVKNLKGKYNDTSEEFWNATGLFYDSLLKLYHLERLIWDKDENLKKEYKPLMRLFVGFDWFSDERLHKHCPFGHERFIKFVNKVRKKVNPRFGFRFHCGELCFDDSEHYPHLLVACKVIEEILKEVGGGTPLRIGHGLAFYEFKDKIGKKELTDKQERIVGVIKKYFKDDANKRIPVEVNMRSNEVLVIGMIGRGGDTLQNLEKQMGIPIVISTDNDGIWQVHNSDTGLDSVAGEFATLIQSGATDKMPMEIFKNIITRAREFQFGDKEGKGDESEQDHTVWARNILDRRNAFDCLEKGRKCSQKDPKQAMAMFRRALDLFCELADEPFSLAEIQYLLGKELISDPTPENAKQADTYLGQALEYCLTHPVGNSDFKKKVEDLVQKRLLSEEDIVVI